MRQCLALGGAVRGAKGKKIVRELMAVAQPRRGRRRPHARPERSAETGDANAVDGGDTRVQRAGRRQRIALRRGQVGPHLRTAVIVMVAVDPVYIDASPQQWRGQFVQRPLALNVAEQHGGAWRSGQRGEAGMDKMPVLVNVADENDGHAVPGWTCRGYHGGMPTLRQQLPPHAVTALDAYEALLRKWNATINLVSAADLPLLWPRHIEDSLQLGTIAGPLPPRAIDLGSGAGFPGLILAIAFGIDVELIEHDQRKAAFLREAVMVTGVHAHVHAMKIERAKLPLPR